MTPIQPTKNSTPYLPEDYDAKISNVMPYYLSFHQEIINFVKSLSSSPKVWMDTGCGTGSLVSKAIAEFPYTKFLLIDPSEGMLDQARKKMFSYPTEGLNF
jgi:tRNA (cmo5U34)-methyltransferase